MSKSKFKIDVATPLGVEVEKKDNVIVWELSPKELQIIETLGGSL